MNALFTPCTTLRLGGALVATSLAMALVAQYGFGLWPCELCIWQRYPAFIAVALAAASLFKHAPLRLLLAGFALACAVTYAIALYHTGIEQGWWQGPSSCSGDGTIGAALSLEQLKAQIASAPVVRCDKPAIELWGFATMAGANMLFSLGLTAWAALSLSKSNATSR